MQEFATIEKPTLILLLGGAVILMWTSCCRSSNDTSTWKQDFSDISPWLHGRNAEKIFIFSFKRVGARSEEGPHVGAHTLRGEIQDWLKLPEVMTRNFPPKGPPQKTQMSSRLMSKKGKDTLNGQAWLTSAIV